MRYEDAYVNVPLGLEEAPEHLRDAYLSPFSQFILEALLIDKTTPVGVFTDLLGWNAEDIENYKFYFFNIDTDMPRLKLYEFICTAPESTDAEKTRKNLLIGVFNYGWGFIDSRYNRSMRILVQEEVAANVRKLFGNLSKMVDQCISRPTLANMRNLLAFMREGIAASKETEINQDPAEKLSFDFVEAIQSEVKDRTDTSSKIMGLNFDEIMKLQAPQGKDLEELNVIRNDVSTH